MRTWIMLAGMVVASCSPADKKEKELLSELPAKKQARVIEVQAEPDSLKGSLQAVATGTIGGQPITIDYYSPAVRGRIIWGGLVPFDQVWVTGAHNCTRITLKTAVVVGTQTVPAGTYAFFTIPGKEQWTLILNKNFRQHLADRYTATEDVVRVVVKPLAADHQERLRYRVMENSPGAGVIAMTWEHQEIHLPVALAPVAGAK